MSWKHLSIRFGIVAVALTAVITVATLWPRGDSQASSSPEVWTCSMHPQFRLPNPGAVQSAICR